jgi:signal transduction histidine kinase
VLVGELADLYAARAEELGVRLEARVVPGLQLRGHRQLLAQALANLIENALKFTPAGGHIEVALDRDGPRATLAVADSGPGIPAAERERAMAPFVRLGNGAGREGTGLGLSLAAAVARLHGGALRLQDNHPGLRALLDLPLRPPAGAPMSAATPAA